MNDQIIYQKIGQLLIDSSPSDAKKIIVRAQLFVKEMVVLMNLIM